MLRSPWRSLPSPPRYGLVPPLSARSLRGKTVVKPATRAKRAAIPASAPRRRVASLRGAPATPDPGAGHLRARSGTAGGKGAALASSAARISAAEPLPRDRKTDRRVPRLGQGSHSPAWLRRIGYNVQFAVADDQRRQGKRPVGEAWLPGALGAPAIAPSAPQPPHDNRVVGPRPAHYNRHIQLRMYAANTRNSSKPYIH